MEELHAGTHELADYRKSMALLRAVPKDCKVIVEGSSALDAQAAHDGKAGSVDEGKVLISKGMPNLPGNFQIRQHYRFNRGHSAAQAFPKTICGRSMNSVTKQHPGFHQHMIGCQQRLATRQDRFRVGVIDVSGLCRRVPHRCIDKQGHALA